MENREKLYNFLIQDFGLHKVQEEFQPENFGNFFVVLFSKEFLLRYVNDRSFLSIDIASQMKPSKWYDLSIVKALLYNEQILNETTGIEELNEFLRKELNHISELFGQQHYSTTKMKLEELSNQRAKQMFQ